MRSPRLDVAFAKVWPRILSNRSDIVSVVGGVMMNSTSMLKTSFAASNLRNVSLSRSRLLWQLQDETTSSGCSWPTHAFVDATGRGCRQNQLQHPHACSHLKCCMS